MPSVNPPTLNSNLVDTDINSFNGASPNKLNSLYPSNNTAPIPIVGRCWKNWSGATVPVPLGVTLLFVNCTTNGLIDESINSFTKSARSMTCSTLDHAPATLRFHANSAGPKDPISHGCCDSASVGVTKPKVNGLNKLPLSSTGYEVAFLANAGSV